jgi:hypothetical protein
VLLSGGRAITLVGILYLGTGAMQIDRAIVPIRPTGPVNLFEVQLHTPAPTSSKTILLL